MVLLLFLFSLHAAVWELVQGPARQLFSVRWRLRSDGVARWRTLERRALQLSPRLHLQERHLWVAAFGSRRHASLSNEDLNLHSLVRTATQSPKHLNFWKGSPELRDQCSCALSLCSGLPAKAKSADQMPVRGQMGEATGLVHSRWVQGHSAGGGPEPPWA